MSFEFQSTLVNVTPQYRIAGNQIGGLRIEYKGDVKVARLVVTNDRDIIFSLSGPLDTVCRSSTRIYTQRPCNAGMYRSHFDGCASKSTHLISASIEISNQTRSSLTSNFAGHSPYESSDATPTPQATEAKVKVARPDCGL